MRKRVVALAVLACFAAAKATAVTPAHREIQASLSYGVAVPGGEWEIRMETGSGVALDVGVALTPRLTAGLHASLDAFEPKPTGSSFDSLIQDSTWRRYVGGAYGEFLFSPGGSLSPFMGASLGVHGVHVGYPEIADGSEGWGDFALGFGFSAGLRYRSARHFGVLVRLDAERSPGMMDGWFYIGRAGLSLFL